jgi:branched-chain amino acid aminotransferase
MEYAYVNGKYTPANKATVSIFDRGLVLGDGLFETLKAIEGKPEFFKEHYQRLSRSAKRLKIKVPTDEKTMLQIVQRLCKKSGFLKKGCATAIRITLTRGVYKGALSLEKEMKPTLIITARLVPPVATGDKSIYKKGVRVIVSSVSKAAASGLDPSVKTTNYLANIFAKAEADQRKAYEAILLGAKGDIAELSTANFFGFRKGVLYTPPLEVGILPGITRQQILLIGKKMGCPVVEKPIKIGDVTKLEEAFLTSSIRGVVPIVKVDKTIIGAGKVGEQTQKWSQAYLEQANRSRGRS